MFVWQSCAVVAERTKGSGSQAVNLRNTMPAGYAYALHVRGARCDKNWGRFSGTYECVLERSLFFDGDLTIILVLGYKFDCTNTHHLFFAGLSQPSNPNRAGSDDLPRTPDTTAAPTRAPGASLPATTATSASFGGGARILEGDSDPAGAAALPALQAVPRGGGGAASGAPSAAPRVLREGRCGIRGVLQWIHGEGITTFYKLFPTGTQKIESPFC